MRRLGCLLLLLILSSCTETASTPPASGAAPQDAQPGDPKLAARCAELGAIYDQYNQRRSEGSGGPNLDRVGAGIDCQRGRYAKGIATLEKLLQQSRTPYPPA